MEIPLNSFLGVGGTRGRFTSNTQFFLVSLTPKMLTRAYSTFPSRATKIESEHRNEDLCCGFKMTYIIYTTNVATWIHTRDTLSKQHISWLIGRKFKVFFKWRRKGQKGVYSPKPTNLISLVLYRMWNKNIQGNPVNLLGILQFNFWCIFWSKS